MGIGAHRERWGPLPLWLGSSLIDELERSGLRGHGGAWFPVGTKWRSVRRTGFRSPVVVANGAEGEPASGKDRFLMARVPHLVLDGAVLAASSIGATQVLVHLPSPAVPAMHAAIEERSRHGVDSCAIGVVVAPDRFLAGQESAVVNTANGRSPGIPSFVRLRSVREAGVGGRPTLVQNVESLAHVSLIARFGADWFRRVGTDGSPGSALLTVTGRWPGPRIVEAELGVPLGRTLSLGADAARSVQGVLLGGYGGGWVSTAEAMTMPLTEEAARRHGSTIGPGVVVLLPSGICPLLEVSRVVRYLAAERSGQCGPCVHGLDALSSAVDQLAFERVAGGTATIPTLCNMIEGRGACAHPDGAVRFVRTALQVFEAHILLHRQRGPCSTTAPPFLAIPPTRRTTPR